MYKKTESHDHVKRLSIPQLAGTVAFSVKDNLREHKGDPSDDSGDGMFSKADESTSLSDEGGDLTEADTDDDLSAEEMA
ncbi:hypothetical protein OPV22_032525 [Ensete ventricosum]|uniref:Uncharacterized protein n=1 Tax=Ensete ventricosum TaxID=4639 RepID=A0AAV8PZI6_ENSVE|nr:hypothetical protein OPV22_032525 [Ensete ventricosum]